MAHILRRPELKECDTLDHVKEKCIKLLIDRSSSKKPSPVFLGFLFEELLSDPNFTEKFKTLRYEKYKKTAQKILSFRHPQTLQLLGSVHFAYLIAKFESNKVISREEIKDIPRPFTKNEQLNIFQMTKTQNNWKSASKLFLNGYLNETASFFLIEALCLKDWEYANIFSSESSLANMVPSPYIAALTIYRRKRHTYPFYKVEWPIVDYLMSQKIPPTVSMEEFPDFFSPNTHSSPNYMGPSFIDYIATIFLNDLAHSEEEISRFLQFLGSVQMSTSYFSIKEDECSKNILRRLFIKMITEKSRLRKATHNDFRCPWIFSNIKGVLNVIPSIYSEALLSCIESPIDWSLAFDLLNYHENPRILLDKTIKESTSLSSLQEPQTFLEMLIHLFLTHQIDGEDESYFLQFLTLTAMKYDCSNSILDLFKKRLSNPDASMAQELRLLFDKILILPAEDFLEALRAVRYNFTWSSLIN